MNKVVLFSGGLDSTTTLALAIKSKDLADKVYALSFDYGSTHNSMEVISQDAIVEFYKTTGVDIEHVTLLLPDIFKGAGSALMGESKMPEVTYAELKELGGPSPTVVPFRNGVFISMATAFAITHNADQVFIGIHAEDARNWAYPDCTPEFAGGMANAVLVGTYFKIRLIFPYIWNSKADIVACAYTMGVPVGLTWSCYSPLGGMSCGTCPTCVERIAAFKMNKIVDPITYAVDIDWEDCDVHNW